jgi:hypothetical protein
MFMRSTASATVKKTVDVLMIALMIAHVRLLTPITEYPNVDPVRTRMVYRSQKRDRDC